MASGAPLSRLGRDSRLQCGQKITHDDSLTGQNCGRDTEWGSERGREVITQFIMRRYLTRPNNPITHVTRLWCWLRVWAILNVIHLFIRRSSSFAPEEEHLLLVPEISRHMFDLDETLNFDLWLPNSNQLQFGQSYSFDLNFWNSESVSNKDIDFVSAFGISMTGCCSWSTLLYFFILLKPNPLLQSLKTQTACTCPQIVDIYLPINEQ